MKIEIDIPNDELRTCVSCSSGEMNLTLSVNETIDGYDVTDIVSDTYAGNASLNFRIVEKASCEDCINRQAVLEYIEGSEAELGHSSENELVCQDIKEFPPVTPAPKDLEKPEIPELPKSVAGYINQSLEKMTTFEETEDEFIFEHLARWYGSVTSLTGVTRIPKRLLIRSVECFKREHREEFEAIMKGEK